MEITLPLPGNDYLPTITVQIYDNSEGLRAIRQWYGPTYWKSPNAIQEASKLWGIKCNEHGVIPRYSQRVEIAGKGNCGVEIKIAETLNGKSLIGVDAQTSMAGFSYAPSVFAPIGYQSIEDARLAGIYKAGSYLSARLRDGSYESGKTSLQNIEQLLRKLEEETQPKFFWGL